jgi:RHS repeat-associated protein
MFYPNAYLNFNHNGEYTKHYYNGSERIASRLGDMTAYIYAEAGERLENRIMRQDALFRSQIGELVSYEEPPAPAIPADRSGGTRELVSPPVEYEPFLSVSSLQQTGSPDDIFYYHTNHLGSTAYVTDQSQNITQGFLYAPFGEITTEYNPTFYSNILPKYSFNAKELDEETGMYYYEARYYKPPVFTSRDPMFEKKPWLSPYHYCSNNPVGRVDYNGMDDYEVNRKTGEIKLLKTTDDNFDRLVAQNKKGVVKYKINGDYKKSIIVDKNIVDDKHRLSEYIESDELGNRTRQEMFFGSDERSAKAVFTFLSRNTDVEWGVVGYEENVFGINVYNNYVGTSGSSKFEAQISAKAKRRGRTVNYYYHSHPGYDASSLPSTGKPTEYGDDLGVWKIIWENSPDAEMGILAAGLPFKRYVRSTTSSNGYMLKR